MIPLLLAIGPIVGGLLAKGAMKSLQALQTFDNPEDIAFFLKQVGKLPTIPPGDKFTLRILVGETEWEKLTPGTRISFGKTFYKVIEADPAYEVIALDRGTSNSQWYQKIKKEDDIPNRNDGP